jgi:histidinol dehydrogenase
MVVKIALKTLGPQDIAAAVSELVRSSESTVETEAMVAEILASVKKQGFAAVREYSVKFDGVSAAQSELEICVSKTQMQRALDALQVEQPKLVAALETMVEHVRAFAIAERAALADVHMPLPGGGSVGQRWVPLSSVGVYVPGGRAFYPSTLAMTVLPAQVAKVDRIVAITPPRKEEPDPRVLATARLVGLEELLMVGGAQGIAHLAYGIGVDLIAGPGNRYVAEAKRQLLGHCGIDSVAGPTEVLVLADDSANPLCVAEDMLAQAEHDPDAAAVCVAESADWLLQVHDALIARVADSPRRAILEASLSRNGRLYVADQASAIQFGQAWAPEHLQIVVRDAAPYVAGLHTAGALFIGHASAEAFGDYGAGPNHVLPTGRTARYASPLGVATYLKRQSLLALSEADARTMAPWVSEIATAEGLVHHAESAQMRARARART